MLLLIILLYLLDIITHLIYTMRIKRLYGEYQKIFSDMTDELRRLNRNLDNYFE